MSMDLLSVQPNHNGGQADVANASQPAVSARPVDLSQPANTAQDIGGQADQPQLADDSDLIEDEWVTIAKRIVEQYKGDPYALTRAIALLRVDYLKKRYNKEAKVA